VSDNNLQLLAESIANSFAMSLCEFSRSLLSTGLSPDELLDCAMRAYVKAVPGFVDVSQESLQLFADSLGVAISNRMLLEHDLILLERRGVKPS
jgi:hypothetical protein